MAYHIRSTRLVAILIICFVIVPIFAIQIHIPKASAAPVSTFSLPSVGANGGTWRYDGATTPGAAYVQEGGWGSTVYSGAQWHIINPNSAPYNEYIEIELNFPTAYNVEWLHFESLALVHGSAQGNMWAKLYNGATEVQDLGSATEIGRAHV